MNPLMNNILPGNLSGNIQQIRQMMNTVRNPQQFISNNPQLKQIMDMCNGNPEQMFYQMCRERGVNPQTILKELSR